MRVFILLLFSILSIQSFAQLKPVINKTTYNFWLNTPKDSTENKPLIVFLHGRSLSGTDINRAKRYGAIRGIERGLEIPAYVVAPQLPNGPWNPEKVNEIVDYMTQNYKIDASRIYVTGMSLGSYGTMKFVAQYHHKIAAAISICGGGDLKDACNLTDVPIQVIHGDKDFIVPISESKKIVNAIKKCRPDAPLEFKIIKGGNHGSVENLYRSIDLYNWLLQHKKQLI